MNEEMKEQMREFAKLDRNEMKKVVVEQFMAKSGFSYRQAEAIIDIVGNAAQSVIMTLEMGGMVSRKPTLHNKRGEEVHMVDESIFEDGKPTLN